MSYFVPHLENNPNKSPPPIHPMIVNDPAFIPQPIHEQEENKERENRRVHHRHEHKAHGNLHTEILPVYASEKPPGPENMHIQHEEISESVFEGRRGRGRGRRGRRDRRGGRFHDKNEEKRENSCESSDENEEKSSESDDEKNKKDREIQAALRKQQRELKKAQRMSKLEEHKQKVEMLPIAASQINPDHNGFIPQIAQSEIMPERGGRRGRGRRGERRGRRRGNPDKWPKENFEVSSDTWSTELDKPEFKEEEKKLTPEQTAEQIELLNKKMAELNLMREELEKSKKEHMELEAEKQKVKENEFKVMQNKEKELLEEQLANIDDLLETYVCPISQEIVTDPVIAEDGHTYERISIENWLKTHSTSPMTSQPIGKKLVPNFKAKTTVLELQEKYAKIEERLKKFS